MTLNKVEKGDPSVSMGIYAMTLFVLGFGEAIGDIVDPGRDDVGLLLDIERLPKRVRPKTLDTIDIRPPESKTPLVINRPPQYRKSTEITRPLG